MGIFEAHRAPQTCVFFRFTTQNSRKSEESNENVAGELKTAHPGRRKNGGRSKERFAATNAKAGLGNYEFKPS